MKTLKILTTLIALLGLALSMPASAAGKFYEQPEFDSLIEQGKPVIVHVHADWCGTCKAQDVQVNAAMNAPEFKQVTFFEVNYEVQKKAMKFFNAKVQSTIIIFRQGKEVARGVADRDPAELQALLKKALP